MEQALSINREDVIEAQRGDGNPPGIAEQCAVYAAMS
jgi:hypothetical protein